MYKNNSINKPNMSTLVVGVDIAKYNSVARAFDIYGNELAKSITFGTTYEGFYSFKNWLIEIQISNKLTSTIVGMEPTGHYWFKLDQFVTESLENATAVLTSTSNVQAMRNLSGLERKKTDHIDAMAIAKTIIFGKYSMPNRRSPVFRQLKELVRFRESKLKELVRMNNKIQKLLDINFPEYHQIYTNWNCKSSIAILKYFSTPYEVVNASEEEILSKLRLVTNRGIGPKKIRLLKEVASRSISLNDYSDCSKYIFSEYINDYVRIQDQITIVDSKISELLGNIDYVDNLIKIHGLTEIGVASILSETGDLRNFEAPKQLLSYAGIDLKINQSGTKKGKTSISKRGNSRLRAILFKFLLPLIGTNKLFNDLHKHYINRDKNPLKGMQSLIAIACKLLRTMHGMVRTGTEFNENLILKPNIKTIIVA